MNWQHDGSFAGFLTAVFRIYEARDDAARLCSLTEAADLFSDAGPVAMEEALARRVYRGLVREAGLEAASFLRDAFLHRDPGGSDALLGYVRQAMQHGPHVLERLADPAVHETDRRARAVQREAHRFQGLLRFRAVDSDELSLYAAFRPDHDVLPLLLPHFRDRLGERSWMIHDIGRRQAAMFRLGGFERLDGISVDRDIPESIDEAEFQALWRDYFQGIAIPERRNPALQRSLMPKKYWDLLVEQPAG